ncbi:MAG: HRDC domain-containing protein [Anaerolineaceae bacterium]|nr:HRDC domain-containing protein [Anaerolineaceae bacterium]
MDLPELTAPIWVNRASMLGQMVKHLVECPILAVDTESNSLHAYREQVCLIQFSTEATDYLVDPLGLHELSALGPIFANPVIEKIFHASEYDLICLRRDFHFQFSNIFDTMLAARILAKPAVGLGSLLEAEFGITLDKHFQRADWALRPLPPAQMAYARLDTHYLKLLRDRLRNELIEMGRLSLAEEDFRRMAEGIPDSNPDEIVIEPFWRISGVQDLSPQQAAVLRELALYREQQAKAANLPPFKVLGNQNLLAIAQALPADTQALAELGALSERQFRRHGQSLLRAVQRGLEAQPLRRPALPRRDERFLNRLDALRTWRKVTAQAMGVESDVVLPKDVLFTLAQRNPRQEEELREVMASTPWRLQTFGERIADVLKKQK